MKQLAGRSFISENTLARAQEGSPTVAIGAYARVLGILGIRGIGMIADFSNDSIGQAIEEESLPKRVRN